MLSIILAITYSARVLVINKLIINNLAKTQLSLEQIKVTCLDISISSDISITINKLCIESPKADIELLDMEIQWHYSPKIQITSIDIRLADIKGRAHLFSNTNNISSSKPHNKKNQNLSQLLSTTLRPYTEQIKQFQLPMKINVAEIYYLPFTTKNQPDTPEKTIPQRHNPPYIAKLSIVDNIIFFLLKNAEGIEFFKAKLTQEEKGFSVNLSSKINLLKSLATAHQLPITKELQNNLTTHKISGDVDLLIKYQADVFNVQSEIIDISIAPHKGIGQNGAFKLAGTINFNSHFTLLPKKVATKVTKKTSNNVASKVVDKNNTKIALTFTGKNEILLEYGQPQLFTLLEESNLSPTIISIVKDNPLNHLKLKVQGNGTITLNDKKGYLSHVEISAHNDEIIHQVKIDNISFSLPPQNKTLNDSTTNIIANSSKFHTERTENKEQSSKESIQKTSYALAVEHFIIDGQLNLVSIAKLLTEPVAIHLEGSLKKIGEKTMLNLTEQSSIKINNIIARASTEKEAKTLFSLKTLTTTLSGTVQQIEANNLSLNLNAHNQALQLNVPKTLKINSFDLFSKIKGNIDNIQIKSNASADNVNLGSIVITGPLLAPKVKVAAKKLQLANLLSLNIQLPINIALIDGTLDYTVWGELTDLSNIENTPLSASFSITSVSGEIDGIWLQELNWQENLTLLSGKITTKPHIKNNLTVELIETFTPISNISINTDWTFSKNFKLSANTLKADIFGGSFSVPTIQWPFEHGHSVNVQLDSIDLEQVLALDKKQGIVVTGNISGELPIIFDGEKYIIEQGELHNISNGLIQVIDNPAVEELKANNSQLQLAFDALQNLHYHQLSSAVSMSDDGYMQLDTIIKGHNPNIDNDVNLNLNVSYDLLGLLESLSITERFEKNIIEGLQKNKE